ncbi:MAG: hypothetical protein QW292_12165 [Candidatus Parvarchaeota archaeon]
MEDNKRKLAELLKVLGYSSKDIRDGLGGTEYSNNFDNRLKIQKIVYILESKTKVFDYDFSLYLRGPYSPGLAKDYYNIIDSDTTSITGDKILNENAIKLAQLLNEKDPVWIEIASTIIMMRDPEDSWSKTIERVKDFKSDVLSSLNKNTSYVDKVFKEMKELELTE